MESERERERERDTLGIWVLLLPTSYSFCLKEGKKWKIFLMEKREVLSLSLYPHCVSISH